MSRMDFFQIFCMFYLQCITRKCAKEKNFDIQRNTRVGSGGQFTSNRLSNDHIFLGIVRLNMLFVRPSVGLTIGASVDQ